MEGIPAAIRDRGGIGVATIIIVRQHAVVTVVVRSNHHSGIVIRSRVDDEVAEIDAILTIHGRRQIPRIAAGCRRAKHAWIIEIDVNVLRHAEA